MTVRRHPIAALAVLALSSTLTTACGADKSTVSAAANPEPLAIETSVVASRQIDRFLRVTGSLLADEQAEVSAESAGRVTETPVERGARAPSS